ncbi:MAG: type VI-B CRISPR-associated RNA-guided ribonuclease Cas13b [Bacteroidales bacterium]|nr:type VI-B CRISPR-associated RNA-guided ribonuclease Cas13b [Bacteroidales bacterium]
MADFIFDNIDADKSRRYIYGTYIEMAFHNFFITLQHIYKCVKGVYPPLQDEDFGKDENTEFIFDDFKQADEKERLKLLLNKHFPYLRVIEDDFNESDKIGIIKKFWEFLKVLRNAAEHDDKITKNLYANNKADILRWLRTDIGSGKDVKKRGIAIAAKKEMKDRYFLSRDPKSVFYFMNNCVSTNGEVSFRSFLIFVSLFLEGKYTYQFITNSELKSNFFYKEKNRAGVVNQIEFRKDDFVNLYRALSIYNINLPAVKYDAQFDKTNILGLDIINELQKCPHELFEHISLQDQNRFRVKGSDNADYPEDILLKRFQDRFATLVLRYIDTQKLFKDIRFQVSLGKYRFKFYDKQCIDADSADRVRILQKELKTFGRLDDMEEKRRTEWADVLRLTDLENQAVADTADTEPYITDQITRYNIDKQTPKIPLWWDGDCPLPITKDQVKQGQKVAALNPKAFLPVYDLPAMMFLHFLGGNPEKLIKEYYNSYIQLFADIRDGILTPDNYSESDFVQKYKIKLCDVPKLLQDYLKGNNNQSSNVTLENKLAKKRDEILAELTVLQKQLDDEKKKFKSGKLAIFLSQSIVSLISDNNIKPTGKNYSILQANLAVYESFDKVNQMFANSKIINNHPFLEKVLAENPKNTLAFYKSYLKEAILFFTNIDNCKNLKFYKYILDKQSVKNADYYKKLAKKLLENGFVELTGRIFDSEIRKLLSTKIDGNVYETDSDGLYKYNLSFFIDNFYYDYQPFYDFDRGYKYLQPQGNLLDNTDYYYEDLKTLTDILRGNNRVEYEMFVTKKIAKEIHNLQSNKRIPPQKKKDQLEKLQKIQEQYSADNLKRYRSEMKKNETIIKRYRIQDKILFEMAKTLLKEKDDATKAQICDIAEMTLSNIMPDDNVFDKPMQNFSVTVILNGNPLTITADNAIKVKNYSTVFKTIFDRRLETLAKLISTPQVSLRDIEAEFEQYDREALKINKLLFDFVSQFNTKRFANNNALTNPLPLKEYDFSDINDKAQRKLKNNPVQLETFDYIRVFRNCFAHWSYPSEDTLSTSNVTVTNPYLNTLCDKMRNHKDLGKKITDLNKELEAALGNSNNLIDDIIN